MVVGLVGKCQKYVVMPYGYEVGCGRFMLETPSPYAILPQKYAINTSQRVPLTMDHYRLLSVLVRSSLVAT